MARKKDVEALFEVITKSKSGGKDMPGLTIPEWMRKPVSPEAQPQDSTPPISDDLSDDSDLPPLELPPPRKTAVAPAVPAAPAKPATVNPPAKPAAAEPPAAVRATVTEPILPARKSDAASAVDTAPTAPAVVAPPSRPAPRRPLRMPQMSPPGSGQGVGFPAQSLLASLKPVVKIENRQLSLVFTPASMAVMAGAAMLLLIAMFVVGWFSRPARPAELSPAQVRAILEKVRPQLEGQGVNWEQMLAMLPGQPTGPAPQPQQQQQQQQQDRQAVPPTRTVGKSYMIIQGLGGKSTEDLREAWRIQKFCSEGEFPATVSLLQGQYVIYSLTGFDTPDEAAAKEYAEKIRVLGQKYKTQTQGREFKQTDPQGRWPWFLKYSGPGPAAG
ncbi:MAG: hypothetical protein ABFD92_08215 [Planctomycetaceae bacterium]|nr:hypothetical protein [Planctomycetaceae bacterium]